MSKPNHKYLAIIALILAGEAIFFLPFVLPRIFRPTLLNVFEITNLELGTCFSTYGIVAMVSYLFGGPLADKFPARNLMITALWSTALGGLVMATLPNTQILMVLYGYWGFTTIFLFWAALIRATREWGGIEAQGKAFGLLESGRGLTAALLGSLALIIFSWLMPDSAEANTVSATSFQLVLITTSGIVFLTGLLVWVFIPKQKLKANDNQEPSANKVWELIQQPIIWMQAVMIVCGYVGYKITDDFSLYANEVLGFSEVASAGIGTSALWTRPIFALLAGFLADKFNGSKIISFCFAFSALGGLAIYTGWANGVMVISLLLLTFTLIGVYGIRSIYFALMQEASIPLHATGTAVGIMSVLGFTPDIFMSPLMGYLLDNYSGEQGHQYVFLTLMLFSVAGLITSFAFRRLIKGA